MRTSIFAHSRRALAGLTLLLVCSVTQASPWLEAEDAFVRQSLLVLANAGIINVPVNTYPLPWRAILADLEQVNENDLTPEQEFALNHVRHQLNQAKFGPKTAILISGHSEAVADNMTLAGYGQNHHERGKLGIRREFLGQRWAARIQANHRIDPIDGRNDLSFDGSYAAMMFGEWIVSIDALPLWWGPGQDSALTMSTHARPLEKIQLSRFRNKAFDLPILSWLGPVSGTAFIGQPEAVRGDTDGSYMWGARVTARPFHFVELGLSHTAQVNGERLVRDEQDRVQIDDNHMLAADIRVSWSMNNGHSGAVYAEVANDTGDHWYAGSAWLAGAEWHFGSSVNQHSLFIEATDTLAQCQENAPAGNCFYEHADYIDGYRHHGQSLGSMFDTDSRALTLGYRWYNDLGQGMQLKLRNIEFNRDDSQPLLGGHPVFGEATERQQIEVSHRRGVFTGLLEVGLQGWRDRNFGESEWQDAELGGYVRWEWRF